MRISASALLSLAIFLFLIPIAYGSDHYVPSEYGTIQTAIEASSNGDTVWVADGIYSGPGNTNIDLMGKAITVRSVNGQDNTIINCGNNGRGFLIINGEDENTIIEGFKIQNGNVPDWPDGGGGIFCSGTAPIIRFCHFDNNHAYFGGGVYFDTAAKPTIENCRFTLNTAEYGAALYGKYSSPVIMHCEINGNMANWTGGGLYLHECTDFILSDSAISTNTALNKSGGGLFSYYSFGQITNCEFSNNIAGGYDGGAINTYGRIEITDSSFLNNFAKDDGGAIFTWASSDLIENCYFDGNSADGAGGGIYFYNQSTSILKNCVFNNNSSSYGAAIYCFWDGSCQPVIINCSISNNTGGGGIYCAPGSQPKIYNTIVWANEPAEIIWSGDPIDVTYSDIRGGYPGIGNIMEDPLFADPDNQNYRLSAGSPCIDAGTALGAPNDDLDGSVRPIGDGYDMGAYEFFSALAGDLDSDNDVDGFDLYNFIVFYSNKTYPDADINSDGFINSADIERFGQEFGVR